MSLFRRRMLWWPTWKGWLLFCAITLGPMLVWGVWGEQYLASSSRVGEAKVLVVEGWVGRLALAGAAKEFQRGGYDKIVTAGCWSEEKRWSFAQVAARELRAQGIDSDVIMEVALGRVEQHRTYETAKAVASELDGISGIDVFTRGAHSRRSGLVYRKVFSRDTSVGRIAWWSEDDEKIKWWDSTQRTKEFITESLAYWIELIFDGGR